MALVWTLNVTVADGILPKPHLSTISINFTGATVAAWNSGNLQAIVDEYLPLIDDLIDGKIVGAGWVLTSTLPSGMKAAAEEFSDVEEGARFTFTTLIPFKTSLRLPTFKESKMLPNSKQVDLTDGGVIAFVDAMEDGVTISTVNFHPADARGEQVTVLASARDAFQKDRG